jgi:hypothetical protein
MLGEITSLGRFRLDVLLRKTQQADIYRGLDTVLKRTVVLRVFKPAWLTDQRVRVRLLEALQNSADLVHPHIAWVWDLGEELGRIFSAERFVEGQLLEEILLRERRLPWEKAYLIFRQAAQALDFAHEHEVVHGGLQINHVILSMEHGVVVDGFGLRHVFYPDAATTRLTDQQALAQLLLQLITGAAIHAEGSPLPMRWPLSFPRLVEEPLKRALGIHPLGPFSSVNEFALNVKEAAERPQPPLAEDEIALLQLEEQELQAAREADRKAAEEAERQKALEDARREINEQLQLAMGESVFSDEDLSDRNWGTDTQGAESPAEGVVNVQETPPNLEAAHASLGNQGIADQEAEVISEKQQTVVENELESPSSSLKKRRRRRIVAVLFVILIVLLMLGLVWAWRNGFLVLNFRI